MINLTTAVYINTIWVPIPKTCQNSDNCTLKVYNIISICQYICSSALALIIRN